MPQSLKMHSDVVKISNSVVTELPYPAAEEKESQGKHFARTSSLSSRISENKAKAAYMGHTLGQDVSLDKKHPKA